jgi:undecaprenyl-diphosphatase
LNAKPYRGYGPCASFGPIGVVPSATMISDRELLLTLNSLVGSDGLLYLWKLVINALFARSPIFFALVALWFSGDCRKRRSRMLAGLLAVCLATVLSVWLQYHFAPHIRPLVDPALHLKIFDPQWSLINWDRKGSFPSDTATLFFALATVIFLETRLVGLICFCWVGAMLAVPRVVFGFHYPSDIIGSLVLGPAVVFLFNKIPYPRLLIERGLMLFEDRMYIVHALLFVFLTEAFNLFQSSEQLGRQLLRSL